MIRSRTIGAISTLLAKRNLRRWLQVLIYLVGSKLKLDLGNGSCGVEALGAGSRAYHENVRCKVGGPNCYGRECVDREEPEEITGKAGQKGMSEE